MTPLDWKWAGFVWAYALVWFLVNDRVKLLAYRIFDPVKANPKPGTKMDAQPKAKAASQLDTSAIEASHRNVPAASLSAE